MLSHYISLIQVIAAVYFSMCFEQLIEKFFWNKKHNENMENVKQKIETTFTLTDEDKEKTEISIIIDSELTDKRNNFIVRVKLWSVVMFISITAILLFTGIEQSYKICIYQHIIIILPIVLLIPAIIFFIQGWNKTQRYVKKINKLIDKEINVFYKNTQDIFIGNIDNINYNRILAEIINDMNNEINKDFLLLKIMEKFKENSLSKIKEIIRN